MKKYVFHTEMYTTEKRDVKEELCGYTMDKNLYLHRYEDSDKTEFSPIHSVNSYSKAARRLHRYMKMNPTIELHTDTMLSIRRSTIVNGRLVNTSTGIYSILCKEALDKNVYGQIDGFTYLGGYWISTESCRDAQLVVGGPSDFSYEKIAKKAISNNRVIQTFLKSSGLDVKTAI